MYKPNHRELNSLVDPHRSLDEIFEEGRKRCEANMQGADENLNGAANKETKQEKEIRLKEEQVRKHIKYLDEAIT